MYGTGTGAFAEYAAVSEAQIAVLINALIWVIVLGTVGMSLALQGWVERMSAPAAFVLFFLYATLMGVALTPIFWIYQLGSIGAAFIVILPIIINLVLPSLGALVGVEMSTAALTHAEQMIFGALIVWFLIVEPHGLAKLWSVGKQKLRLWPFPH